MRAIGYYLDVVREACLEVGKYLLSEFGSVKRMYHRGELHYGVVEDKEANKIHRKIFRQKTTDVSVYS